MSYARECTRVYAPNGKIAHLLPPGSSPDPGGPFTLCQRHPRLFGVWLGTGTQDEHEKAAALPLCTWCTRSAARRTEAEGHLSSAPGPADPVEDLWGRSWRPQLSSRAVNGLRRAGIRTVGALTERTGDDLREIRELGARSVAEIRRVVAEHGLALAGEEPGGGAREVPRG